MTSKRLNQVEIENFLNLDWDDSEIDSESDDNDDENFLENVIEETLLNLDETDIDIDLIEKAADNGTELSIETINEETAQVVEKINLDSLRWRSTGMNECDTVWKNEVTFGICKDPLAYFVDFFDDEIIQKICAETNIYAMQTNGLELKCEPYEIKRFIGSLLYLGAVKIPQMRMAWVHNFRLTAISESLSRNRFEKIKQYFHINDNSTQLQINHRSKKWYMRIVYWCINSAVVNSWLLYRRDKENSTGEKKFMSLLDFQLHIANELLHATNITIISRKRGRPTLLSMSSQAATPTSSAESSPAPAESSSPRSSSPSSSAASSSFGKKKFAPNPEKNKRYDQMGHFVEWGSKGRCRLCQTGCPRSKCIKCKVYLCCNPQKNCFLSFHT